MRYTSIRVKTQTKILLDKMQPAHISSSDFLHYLLKQEYDRKYKIFENRRDEKDEQ